MQVLTFLSLSLSLSLYFILPIGYSIQDLADEFETDAALWLITPAPCTTCSLTYQTDSNNCNTESKLVLGGPEILSSTSTDTIAFQRTYKDLSAHVFLTFSVNFYYFGRQSTIPSGQSIVSLQFDGQTVTGPRVTTSDVCSDSTSPTLMLTTFQGSFSHSSSSLTLVIQTLFPFQEIQVGFREVVLLLYTFSPPTNSDAPICQTSTESDAFLYDECTCPLGEGSHSPGGHSCSTCLYSCSTCFMMIAPYCYTCENDYFWSGALCAQSPPCCASYNGTFCSSCTSGCFYYGNGVCQASCDSDIGYYSIQVLSVSYCFTKCPDSSSFRYLNGSCLSSCPPPLTHSTSSTNNLNYCYNPCSSSQYLYPDGSCNAACSTPLKQITIGDILYCQSPCSDSSQFYFDATISCLSSCSSPLDSREESGIKYCSNPCQTSEYLYEDGTCSDSCLPPLITRADSGVNYCSLCDGYLSADDACLAECNSPFTRRAQGATIYCDSPCSNSADYYYQSDGSCQSQCEAPNQITNENGLQICTLMVTQTEDEQVKTIAKTANTANSISSGAIVASSLLASGDATAATLGSLTKMLSYIKFMNIQFPPKLQLLFDSQSTNSSLLSSIPNSLRDKIGNSPPPSNFGEYNVSSSFMINFWQSLVILGAILIAILVSLLFSIFFKRAGALQKISSALKWNAFLTLFCSYCGDIVMFSALEFQTVQYDNFWSVLSLTLSILLNTLMGYTLYKILIVNFSIRKIQQNKTIEEDIEKTFADYKTLFECYKGDSYLQQIYLFIFMIRVGFFNGIIGSLYPYPLVQAILIIFINIAILGYLLLKRPMKKIINLIQQVLLESTIFVFNIGVFILAILDAQDQENSNTRENIGDMLIMINVIVPILSMVLIAIKILLIIWEFYQSYKNARNNKTICIQQTRTSYSKNASPGVQPIEATPSPKNLTNNNLLQTNYSNNTLFSIESKLDYCLILTNFLRY